MNRSVASCVVCAGFGAAIVLLLGAGPLTPPAGSVAPAYKTLDEIEPRIPLSQATAPGDLNNLYRIEQPGSYYLTGNVIGVSGKNGILVSTSGVTLDLNGFTVQGLGPDLGITSNGTRSLTIRNGHVDNWHAGVNVTETYASHLDNITSSNNTTDGFQTGFGAIVTNCRGYHNGTSFDCFADSTLVNCSARDDGARGFSTGPGCVLTNCNCSSGVTGFYIDGHAVLTNCTADDNVSFGFYVLESGVLTDCTAFGNDSVGFRVVARSRLTRCNSRNNLQGFWVIEGNSLVECTASANTNKGVYISGNANTIERCTLHENASNGIYVDSGVGNTIDGNLVTYNGDIGIFINNSDNLTTRNRARGNTGGNYSFIAGADYGVILTNPGAGFTSSAAWANFEY